MDDDDFIATDLIDLALLGLALGERPRVGPMVERLRGLCSPWLTPTVDVIEGRIDRLVGGALLDLAGNEVAVGAGGRSTFLALMLRPIRAASHDLRFCAENLKLAFLGLLPEPQRDRVGADLLTARRRCLACIGGMLDGCGPDRPSLRNCLSHQRRLMTAELEVMARALSLEA